MVMPHYGIEKVLVRGGPQHKHVEPGSASSYPRNTVVRSVCGHLYVRRHSLGWIIPMGDHWDQFVRLRPWHVVAWLRLLFRGVDGTRKEA